MKTLLKASPFKLFMLLAGIPFAVFFVLFLFATFSFYSDSAFGVMEIIALTGIVLLTAYTVLLMSWLNTLGRNLSVKVQPDMRPNRRMFRICIATPIVYMILTMVLLSFMGRGFITVNIIPFVIAYGLTRYFAMAAMLYGAFVTARMIKSIETGCAVRFEEFAGEFFLLIFFPVGIWFLQPRIQSVFTEEGGLPVIARP